MKDTIMNVIKENIKILNNTNFKIPEKYAADFKKEILKTNRSRLKKFCIMLVLLNIIMIVIDVLQYNTVWFNISSYRWVFLSHVIMPIFLGFFADIFKEDKKYSIRIEEFLHFIFIIIILAWTIMVSIITQKMDAGVYSYMLAIFYVSTAIILNIRRCGAIYITAYMIMIAGMIMQQNNAAAFSSNLVNSFLINVVAIMASAIIYSNYASNFLNKKIIAEKNQELELSKKNLEDEIKQRTEELIRTNEEITYEKLRTEFFANVSHELRTPLNVIFCAQQLISATIRKGEDNSIKIEQYTDTIKQNCYRLIRLIGNLIDITKMDSGNFEITIGNHNIVKIIEDIALSVATYIENKGIELTFDTEFEEKIIACDPDKIERIILNLLSNAIKFTEAGGHIYVNITQRGSFVQISVRDTGTGIPSDRQSNIFKRFVQVDKSISRKSEGSGIGLSLVKSLVEMQAGKITLISEYGKGSEFIVMLPDGICQVGEEEIDSAVSSSHDKVEKINIEFSDIYM